MKQPTGLKSLKDEDHIQAAMEGYLDGTYQSIRHATTELKVKPSTLHHRIKGRETRSAAHSDSQALTPNEEIELVRWITKLTITGYPPGHCTLWSMAEMIRK